MNFSCENEQQRRRHNKARSDKPSVLNRPFNAICQPLNRAARVQRTTNGTITQAEESKHQRHGRDKMEQFVIPENKRSCCETQTESEILTNTQKQLLCCLYLLSRSDPYISGGSKKNLWIDRLIFDTVTLFHFFFLMKDKTILTNTDMNKATTRSPYLCLYFLYHLILDLRLSVSVSIMNPKWACLCLDIVTSDRSGKNPPAQLLPS